MLLKLINSLNEFLMSNLWLIQNRLAKVVSVKSTKLSEKKEVFSIEIKKISNENEKRTKTETTAK
jgi:hypothetical protein